MAPPQGQDLPLYNIFLGVYPSLSPLRSIEYYSIWLENGSDHLDIQGEGCAEGESRLDLALGWKGRLECQKEVQNYCFKEKGWCVSQKNRCSLTCFTVFDTVSLSPSHGDGYTSSCYYYHNKLNFSFTIYSLTRSDIGEAAAQSAGPVPVVVGVHDHGPSPSQGDNRRRIRGTLLVVLLSTPASSRNHWSLDDRSCLWSSWRISWILRIWWILGIRWILRIWWILRR